MYLGIDIGTSAVKAVLVDDRQKVVASASEPLAVSRPAPGWSEQNPQHWWRAVVAAIDALAARQPARVARVLGIGLSGQMHGATLLDAKGKVLRPCILWNDGRSAAQCEAFERAWPAARAVTGNLAMPGFTAPKLLWVREHEPAIFERVRTVLLPKAYVRWRLCGEFVEEMSDAAGTLWLDVARRDWSDDALRATGLARDQMPRLVEGSAPCGRLAARLARRWSMRERPVIAGGAGDNAAGAIGLGAIRPGSAFVSLGTSGVLWATTAGFAPNPGHAVHAFCHAVPDTWHQMGVILSAASSLAWWAGVCGASESRLLAPLGERAGAPSPVVFAPYLSGERTPHNDASVRGTFAGLAHGHGRDAMTLAVLEGVAFAFRDCQEALAAAGTRIEFADVVGGGSRSRLWVDVLANVLGVPMGRLAAGETGGAFGAARLARLACTAEDPAQVCTAPPRVETVTPRADVSARYQDAWRRWRRLYPAVRGLDS